MCSEAEMACRVKEGVGRAWIQQLPTGFLFILILTITCTRAVGNTEFCQMQSFDATCKDNEVILVTMARYGRMRLGRCLTRNYYVGCSADVTMHMHARCSGRRHCRVPIPDPTMFDAQPCPKDLVAYLEADYKCVRVARWNTEQCQETKVQTLSPSGGYVSRPPARETAVGRSCAWRVTGQPGQHVKVYLYDFFSKHVKNDSPPVTGGCLLYGYVRETSIKYPTRICGGQLSQDKLVYTSEGHTLDITLSPSVARSHHYLIKYEVVGCPFLELPIEAWVQMKEETAVVTCNASRTAFHLVCVGTEWVGELRNCSTAPMHPIADSMSDTSNLPFGLFLAISIGVALGVLLGIGLLTLAHTCYNKSRGRRQKSSEGDDGGANSLLKPNPQPGSILPDSCPEHQHQHIHVPITMDTCTDFSRKSFIPLVPIRHVSEHLYESPRAGDLSTFRAARISMTTFGESDSGVDATSLVEGQTGGDVHLTEIDGRTRIPLDCCHNLKAINTLNKEYRLCKGEQDVGLISSS